MPTIEVILLETYTFVIETKQLYNGRNRKYYNSRYSSRSGDGRIQWLSCTRPLSVRNLPIEVQWRGAHFHRDMLIASTQMLILDFFDFHSHLYGEDNISVQNASIMSRFLNMLENGTFREHREVTYYADCLCVTSKYLSEVSKKVSGYTANYWINRYTTLDISRLLRDKSLTFVRISDMFGFSSPAYFSRYVQQHLGVNPTKYRG